MIFLSNQIVAQCFQSQMVYNFENDIQPWVKKNTYSLGHSNTSFESGRSVFAKVSFDQNNQETRAGASTNFNNATQQWAAYQGIQFDFIFVNLATDNTTVGKPAGRPSGNRNIYIELKDQSGKVIKYFFSDESNNWEKRTSLWSDFTGDSNFDFSKVASMGFYTDRNNQQYTEVFRFDDIELVCDSEGNNQPQVKLLSDVAKTFAIPKGAPNYSDVCLTSRGRRTLDHPKYKLRTEDAIEQFHPTRLDWTVVTDQKYVDEVIVPYGMKFSGVLNSKLPDNVGEYTVNANGRCLRSNGTKIEWPWLDTPSNYDQFVGSVNHPDYRQIYLDHASVFYNGAGVNNLVAIQMDEPGFSIRLARNYGGCYGGYDKLKAGELGYNINDYNQNIQFQKASLALFYEEMHNTFKAESGIQDLGFSYNNEGYDFSENRSTQSFDFAMGELNTEITNAKDIFLAGRTAKSYGKIQVFSPTRLVKTGPNNYTTNSGLYTYQTNNAQRDLNRKAIATAYASGSVHFVPWDTWFYDQTRHYGEPDEYADLFAMIRATPQYFDGYEDAALYAPNGSLSETRYNGSLPVKLTASNNNVWAFTRAKPNDADAPVVVHLVNWGTNSSNATVEILHKHINSTGNFTATLVTPKAYNATAHEQARQQASNLLNGLRGSYQASAYQNLINVQQIPINAVSENKMALNLSNLKTWSILIVEPVTEEACSDNDGDGVCNADDLCADGDDNIDLDNDGTPDACDDCPTDANNACSVPTYCSSNGINLYYEYINEVTVGSINNTSGANSGYADFTNITGNLYVGTSVNIRLTPGYVERPYVENWKIWIDFNRDGDFDDAGEEVFSDSGSGKVSGSITIPAGVSLGATGMRVSMSWNDTPNACGTITYGEVEDYTVIILNTGDKIASTIVSNKLFKVFPNPANAFIFIDVLNTAVEIEKDQPVSIQIFSTEGKLLLHKKYVTGNKIQVNIQDLPANQFYLMNISMKGEHQFSTKFLKL